MFRSAAETSSRAARAMVTTFILRHETLLKVPQPILQIMLEKAFRAREHFQARHEPVLSETQPDDELSIFGGKTRLVNPQQRPASPTIAPLTSQPKPVGLTTNQGAFDQYFREHHQQPALPESAGSHSGNYLDNLQATFADLSGGWDGLFHEVPGPSYGLATNSNPTYPPQQSGDGVMLDDRWSSFMHNYSILAESEQPVNQHQHHNT
jgi:hypothetical protein